MLCMVPSTWLESIDTHWMDEMGDHVLGALGSVLLSAKEDSGCNIINNAGLPLKLLWKED